MRNGVLGHRHFHARLRGKPAAIETVIGADPVAACVRDIMVEQSTLDWQRYRPTDQRPSQRSL
jgi:hypothetical protein